MFGDVVSYCFLLFNLVWLLILTVRSLGLFSCTYQLFRDFKQYVTFVVPAFLQTKFFSCISVWHIWKVAPWYSLVIKCRCVYLLLPWFIPPLSLHGNSRVIHRVNPFVLVENNFCMLKWSEILLMLNSIWNIWGFH